MPKKRLPRTPPGNLQRSPNPVAGGATRGSLRQNIKNFLGRGHCPHPSLWEKDIPSAHPTPLGAEAVSALYLPANCTPGQCRMPILLCIQVINIIANFYMVSCTYLGIRWIFSARDLWPKKTVHCKIVGTKKFREQIIQYFMEIHRN